MIFRYFWLHYVMNLCKKGAVILETPKNNKIENACCEQGEGTEESFSQPSPVPVTDVGGKYSIHCLTVIGQIEGHYVLSSQNKTTKYEVLMPQIVAVEESEKIQGLLILLNTVGGDVEAGLAIAELIAGMKKPTVSLVLGGGHSIGVPLAVSADRSFIVPSATMTIHPVRMNGLVLGVPQTLDHFARMQDRITDFVVAHSNMKRERFQQMMMNTSELVTDIGTVLGGVEAVNEGLIDHLGGLQDALDSLYHLIEKGNHDVD